MKRTLPYRRLLTDRLAASLQTAACRAAETARALAPYGDGQDGGHLRDCISCRVLRRGENICGELTAKNPHALFVEAGTSRMRAQPYLRPALREMRKAFLRDLSI